MKPADLIRTFEGFSPVAYMHNDDGKWTVGFGHTGPEVLPGSRMTREQAEAVLERDVSFFETVVRGECPGANENQITALTSLAFNIGAHRFQTSELLRKFKAGDVRGAADELVRYEGDVPHGWIHVNGKVNKGLVARREAEKALFLSPL